MARVPWELKIYFPREMRTVVLVPEYEIESPERTRVLYRSSAFTLRIECADCNVKPVEFKSSLRLQQLTRCPYAWQVNSDSVVLTLALMDAVPRQRIAGGRITVFLDDLPVPFVCEHGGTVYEMVVHSAQPSYARHQSSEARVSMRKNDRPLPHFMAPIAPAAGPRSEADELMQDIDDAIDATKRLLQFFCLPSL
jgi:hypothetical protein